MDSLYDLLGTVKDHRRVEGRRYKIEEMLMLMILGIMNGCNGYQSLSRYFKNNEAELKSLFGLRYGVPSYDTIRLFMLGLDAESFCDVFAQWMRHVVEKIPKEENEQSWLSVDGKAMKGTVSNGTLSTQDFVSIVRVLEHDLGLILKSKWYNNGKLSEKGVVRTLISGDTSLSDKIITADALHCATLTVEKIISNGSHFVIQVKGNCKTLKKT